jgi:hypothetical protein
MIRRERVTATLDGDFVVFLIGMRINHPLKIHKWWPVAAAMPRMLKELHRHPELGFLGAELWAGRTFLVLQYWRSLDQLMDYARNAQTEHLPAWRAFNRSVGTDGSVGIWHETYVVSAGRYENIYVNMPPFGLAGVGDVQGAKGGRQTARARMRGDLESSGRETSP